MTNNNKVVTIDLRLIVKRHHQRKTSFLDNNTFSDAPLHSIYLE